MQYNCVPNKIPLIISTGDISDVDGFMALAEYAKTGADVVFVMNYPAYLNEEMRIDVADFEEVNLGLGFKFKASFEFENEDSSIPKKYLEFMKVHQGDSFFRMKCALTDVAFEFSRRVWREADCGSKGGRGKLFFLVGGENAINPFSKATMKDEVILYSEFLFDGSVHEPQVCGEHKNAFQFLTPNEGMMYDESGRLCRTSTGEATGEAESFSLSNYGRIFMDFNGSMSFFKDDAWLVQELARPEISKMVKGVFIMGGVVADAKPQTMPCIKGILNRFSCATMNQLYHPSRTARFLDFVDKHGMPTFIVTNNVVQDLTTWADDTCQRKTYQGVEDFMRTNGLTGSFLASIARAYYQSPHNPPRKPFDFYTAAALRKYLEGGAELQTEDGRLFYSDSKGVALVGGAAQSWEEARDTYCRAIDHPQAEGDSDFVRAKKASFARERGELAAMGVLPYVGVRRVAFRLDPATWQLVVCCQPADVDVTDGAEHSLADGGDASAKPGPAAISVAAVGGNGSQSPSRAARLAGRVSA